MYCFIITALQPITNFGIIIIPKNRACYQIKGYSLVSRFRIHFPVAYDLSICRYGVSPFEYALGESGGSLQLAIVNAQIKWPAGPNPPYPDALHQFVTWMLQPQVTLRPRIDDIVIHVDKLIAKFSQ